MLDALPKAAFSVLAGSNVLKRMASRYGMRNPGSFARRFIAGESVGEAIAAARVLEQQGLTVTLDLLGESVSSSEEAAAATRAYADAMAEIDAAGVGRNISLKLTQLGLEVDRATCIDNLRRVLDRATAGNFFVRIDMENSPFTEQTLEVLDTVWQIGYRNVGTVIQSYLKRSMKDVERLNAHGRAGAAGEGRVPRAARGGLPAEGRSGCGVCRSDAGAAAPGHVSGDCDA